MKQATEAAGSDKFVSLVQRDQNSTRKNSHAR